MHFTAISMIVIITVPGEKDGEYWQNFGEGLIPGEKEPKVARWQGL